MPLRFLLATSDDAFRKPAISPVRLAIKQAYKGQASVKLLPTDADAVLRSDLIATDNADAVLLLDAQLPRAAGLPPDVDESAALRLLQTLRDRGIHIPTVVITRRPMGVSEMDEYCNPSNAAIALPLRHLEGKTFAGLVGMLQKPPLSTWDVIEIDVQRTSTTCYLCGKNTPRIKWGSSPMGRFSSVQSLAYEYINLPDREGWARRIHDAGISLFRDLVIFTLGPGLFAHLEQAAGGLQRLAFRFLVDDPKLYTVPFEATVRTLGQSDPYSTNDFVQSLTQSPFVLINAPITRRISGVVLRAGSPASHVPHPARILFIRSQVADNPAGATTGDTAAVPEVDPATGRTRIRHMEFRTLDNIDAELKCLRDRAADNAAILVLDVLDLSQAIDAEGAEKVLRERLATASYDVVHFAGHSLTTNTGMTFLILPSPTPGEAEAIAVRTFADDAASSNARLIYLSSCHGSSANTVASIAQLGVPNVLGFRWDVDDERAAAFAKLFYEALFGAKPMTICEAFRAACNGVYPSEAIEKSQIWASPILASQSDDWMAQRIP
jgi:hypothetical protein